MVTVNGSVKLFQIKKNNPIKKNLEGNEEVALHAKVLERSDFTDNVLIFWSTTSLWLASVSSSIKVLIIQ